MDLRSPLGKVKGLGAAGYSATHHWWMQRITAIALIPLVIWFVVAVIKSTTSEKGLLDMLDCPLTAVALILFIVISLYHGCIGLKVIIEDYVHCPVGKKFLVILVNFVTTVTILTSVLAVVYRHVNFLKEEKAGFSRTASGSEDMERTRMWRAEFLKKLKEAE